MSNVTVLGASGTIAVPFKSAVNATFAMQLANQISTAIKSGALTGTPYNPATPATVTTPSELVIGGNPATTPGATSYTLSNEYTAVVSNATAPVTVTAGAAPVAPLSILGGTGGTTFYSGGSSVGGAVVLGGGTNLVAGSTSITGANDSTDGGLQGTWTVAAGSGTGGSDNIFLSSGADTVLLGANDTVHAGGASVLGLVSNTDSADPTFFIGSQPSTVFGLSSSNVDILGNDGATGGGVYVLGTGGNGIIAAGSGATTLVGGGSGDVLYGNTAAGAQAVFFAGGGNETLQGGFSGGSSTLYGGSGNDVIAAGQTNASAKDVVAAGSGTDTIFSGLGQDSIWFYQPIAKNVHDTIYNFDITTNTLVFQGYGSNNSFSVTSAASAPLQITLADNSTITFANLSTSQAGQLKITSIT